MTRRTAKVLAVLLAVLAAAAIGLGFATDATLAFAIVAAVSASASVWLTWRGNEQQEQMAEDIRRLAELTETSLEEARAQRPEPIIRFLLEGGPATTVRVERTRLDRELDVEQIVEREQELAMATLPVEKPKAPERPVQARQPGPLGSEFERIARQMAEQLTAFGGVGARRTGPATPAERAAFDREVMSYTDRLRSWLAEFQQWRGEVHELIRLRLLFDNLGRVPTYDARIDVHFPDPFGEPPDEFPVLSDHPSRPRFARETFRFAGLGGLDLGIRRPHLPLLDLTPDIGNVSRPRYRKGSVHVEIDIKKLLHGVPEESDPITLLAPDDGRYIVPWEIRAENLPEPAHGELELEVITRVEEGPPITTLDELLGFIDAESGEEEPDE